jgi:hypothetical protein
MQRGGVGWYPQSGFIHIEFEANVERAARDMLAVLGDAKGRPREQGSSRRAGPK